MGRAYIVEGTIRKSSNRTYGMHSYKQASSNEILFHCPLEIEWLQNLLLSITGVR